MKKAKELGVRTSFDFNCRARLWSHKETSDAIKAIFPFVDHCFCGELDAIYLLGFERGKITSIKLFKIERKGE
ncbi:MAG: hypothetical protein ACK4M9_18065 [Anaerobacillus sp.]|uniref:hypothetical protein n=1 Tax=Anaerobacillus sp. TaxID=1872506 RepID=UPI00391AEFD2